MEDAPGVCEHPLAGADAGFGFAAFEVVQTVEMIGIAMGDDDRRDIEWVLRGRFAVQVARGDVAREQFVVAAVDQHDLAGRRLQDQPVALLHIDHREFQQPGVAHLQGR